MMDKKFVKSKLIDDYEVLTDTGWIDIISNHTTIPYRIYLIKLSDGKQLKCADNHIVFYLDDFEEVYIKNLNIGDKILVKGDEKLEESEVLEIIDLGYEENMYDLELVEGSNRRYYTNGILSHNSMYIRYLISILADDRTMIYLPNQLISSITDPQFLPLMAEYPNSVLIIEDAEEAIKSRKQGGHTVDKILNLSDGIISDFLGTQIICTFNNDISAIDEALLRKGRLILKHEFGRLDINQAQKLSDKLGKGTTITKPMTLSEVYNQDELYSEDMKERSSIGFRR